MARPSLTKAADLSKALGYFKPRDSYASPGVTVSDNAIFIDQPDGGVVIQFNPRSSNSDAASKDHNANLAEFVSDDNLSRLAEWLLEGIEEDDRSRQEWLRDRSAGIKLLGFKIEEPRSDLASSSAPMEGMSTVRHPILGEAVLHFQANGRGELLPADGPTKSEVWGKQSAIMDDLAEQLETDMNYFLTKTATEYVPDTDRMLFMVGFSGMAFKKVYSCPLKRRPTSVCVDAEHLIVANSATDIQSAPRVTHVIPMQQVTYKRMVLAGVYRETPDMPPEANINPFDAAAARMTGIDLNITRPEDQVHTIYECYTDIDLDGFEHKDENGEISGLPIPYRVTIEKTSRRILEIRRDWKEGDEDCTRKRTFVPFGFVPAFGFYNIGLLQILGNTTSALTGAWRLLLDAGMFSNFPGFLYAKTGARQTNNNFRVPPGGGAPVDIPGGTKLQDAIMALPYKGPDPALMQLSEQVAAQGQRLGGTAELPTAEGKADVPVGTMLAAVEQAGKILDAVHKRMCTAQGTEIELLCDLLRENPAAIWMGTPNTNGWDEQKVLAAFQQYNIVPRCDPNTPSHVHRLMKASALAQVAQQAPPGILDPVAVIKRLLAMMRIDDADSLFLPSQQPGAQPNPDAIKADSAKQANDAKLMAGKQTADAKLAEAKLQDETKRLDILARAQMQSEKLAHDKEMAGQNMAKELLIHPEGGALLGGDLGGMGVA